MHARLDAFIVSVLLVIPTWLYYCLRIYPKQQIRSYTIPSNQNGRAGFILVLFVAAHTTFMLYKLFLCVPLNIFTTLQLPLSEPSGVIRETLLHLSNRTDLPSTLEVLLNRLNSFDARTYYVRFGHDVVLKCEYCQNYYDYALFSLPLPLLEYVREAAVVGLLTLRATGREKWRKWGIGGLVAAALLEGYAIVSKEIIIASHNNTSTTMIHDLLWLARQLLFLILPPILFILPPTTDNASALAANLPQLTTLADQTLARIQLLKYTHGAAARSPELREKVGEWWERERIEGEWGTQDTLVREMAGKLGMGFDRVVTIDSSTGDKEGELRRKASFAVEALKGGFRPSEFL